MNLEKIAHKHGPGRAGRGRCEVGYEIRIIRLRASYESRDGTRGNQSLSASFEPSGKFRSTDLDDDAPHFPARPENLLGKVTFFGGSELTECLRVH